MHLSRSTIKDCDKRVRYTQTTEERLQALVRAGFAPTVTEAMHDCMQIGLRELAERYQLEEKKEDPGECLQ